MPNDALAEFYRLLEPARDRLRKQAAANAAVRTTPVSMGLIVLAVVGFSLSFNTSLAGNAPALVIFGTVCVVAAVVLPVLSAGFVWKTREPEQSTIAARLDHATTPHNLIANGLAVLQRRDTTPFALLAARQGRLHLERVAHEAPTLPETRIAKRALVSLTVLAAAATGLAWLPLPTDAYANADPITKTTDTTRPTTFTPRLARAADDRLQTEHARRPAESPTAEARRSDSSGRSANETTRTQQADTDTNARFAASSTADVASSSSGAARAGASVSPTKGQAASSSDTSEQERSNAAANRPPTSRASSADRASRIRAAAAAAGASLGVPADAGMRDVPDDAENRASEDSEADAEVDQSQQKQRGGARLRLPDRRAAPSRDLGISGPPGGRPGTGRGGPSAVKKSRGTGTMVMGVPEPDFLRGQLNPGPSAVDFTSQPPSTAPAQHPRAAVTAPSRVDENEIAPFIVPWNEAPLTIRYLERLHSETDSDAASATNEETAE